MFLLCPFRLYLSLKNSVGQLLRTYLTERAPMSLINLSKSNFASEPIAADRDHIRSAEQAQMEQVRDRLLHNPCCDSESVRITLLALQNDLLHKQLCRIEESLLNATQSATPIALRTKY
jgi:hypothetical protein